MKKILLLLCLCLFIEEVASRELDKTFQLLPQPQSIELTSGKGINYWELSYILSSDRKSTRLNSSHPPESRMPSSA